MRRQRFTLRDSVSLADHVLIYEPAQTGVVATSVANLVKFLNVASSVVSWGDVTGKPTTFPPVPHTHPISEVTGLQSDNWDTAYGWGNHATAGYLTSINLGSVGGVSISSPLNGQVLKFNGTNWVNGTDEAGGGGVSDGDKGDITVSSSGTAWTVDNDTITNAKLSNVATATIKGRTTAGTGDPEDLTATQAKSLLAIGIGDVSGLQSALDGKIDDDAAPTVTATKPAPVDADQLLMFDSANSGAPVLVTKAQLLSEITSQISGIEALLAAL
jgi:hypothetical protein